MSTGSLDILGASFSSDEPAAARAAVSDFLATSQKLIDISRADRESNAMANRHQFPVYRLAILASFTLEQMSEHLRLRRFVAGETLEVEYWPYNQWYDALKNEGSLDSFSPDAVLLVLHLDDVAPLLARQHLVAPTEVELERQLVVGGLAEAIAGYRERSGKPIILSNFTAASSGPEKYFDAASAFSRQDSIHQLNIELANLAASNQNVHIFDYATLVHDVGRRSWYDRIKNNLNKAALRPAALGILAKEFDAFLTALTKPRRKVVAVDFDNTIWGGVVGEDGVDGIALSGDYPGNAFEGFQAFLTNLRASGIVLAAVSKNNLEDAKEVFDLNPAMPLKWSDFSAHKINWQDKVTNLKAIASELNLGVDSFVFVDDSPLECELVREFLPEVRVVQLDGPPDLFPSKVMEVADLHATNLTNEDSSRAESYSVEKQRGRLKSEATDTRDFLKKLELTLSIGVARSEDMDRVVQLFGKTNQFNLTTKRYDLGDIAALQERKDAEIVVAHLSDRFGAYGLICVAVMVFDDDKCTIDSFLMSCRVLGRNVEESMLAHLEARARGRGSDRILGIFIPTKKNALVSDLYPRFGYSENGTEGVFERDLGETEPRAYPEHVAINPL